MGPSPHYLFPLIYQHPRMSHINLSIPSSLFSPENTSAFGPSVKATMTTPVASEFDEENEVSKSKPSISCHSKA